MSLSEIVEGYAVLLSDIANSGEVQCLGLGWDEVYAGNVEFTAKGWRFTLFNDCDSLDYTDSVTAPDGSQASFDELFEPLSDPIRLASSKLDRKNLERQLKLAKSISKSRRVR